jgi:uroporphyrinogen III methyltransferase/synthase
MSGKVILVGAGPGDPGLLTNKGADALAQAQVVVYDRLVSPEILRQIPPTAKRINVGKNAGHHPVPQQEINQILLEEAQKGQLVVRLKGGDPFLFGRGGEELELLVAHHIPFEVVPGVTSALSVPAYAGIPVTHRDCASSLHIITGHAKAGAPLNIDFEALVRAGGTLVFLMGVSALPQICQGLLNGGMEPDCPAAVVEQGTILSQRKLIATVSTLTEEAKQAHISSPAILIFGQVCRYAEEFDWFDRLPLRGKTVIVTRPAQRMGSLADGLRRLGAQVVEYPCIETVPRTPCPELDQAIETLSNYRWLVFTSPVGPECFFQRLFALGKDVRALGNLKLAAVGPKTAQALARYHVNADLVPAVYDTEHLALALAEQGSGPVLLCRASQGSPVLPQVLREKGIPFADIPCYDTLYQGNENTSEVLALLNCPIPVTFTSGSTVDGFVRSLPEGTDLSQVVGFCIGAQTARRAAEYGITTCVAQEATIDSLIQRILEKA